MRALRYNLGCAGGIAALAAWMACPAPAQQAAPVPTAPQPVIMSSPAPAAAGGPVIAAPPAAPAAHPAEPEGDNPTGRQEPAVSLEWIGPVSAKLGQPVSYQIIVKNISASPVEGVVVRGHIPATATLKATEPKAETEDGALVWKFGTLEPRQDKRIDIQIEPTATGTITPHATVTLSGSAAARLRVFEPKLTVKVSGPEKVVTGDPSPMIITVSNPGDATAEGVKIEAILSEGLEHARGKKIEHDLGNLAPHETRSFQLLCAARAGGTQQCEVHVTGEPRLSSEDVASVEVLVPKVELAVSGPGMRYLDRHATLTFKVTNPGTAAANHVNVVDKVPQGFNFVSATADGRYDFVARTVSWYVGDLPPGQNKEVSVELVAANIGEHKNQAIVTASRSLKAEGEVATRVEGLPALLMELVDLDDPVEVGADTSYEVRVTNTGTKTESNLQLTCTVPDKMEFRGAKGPAGVNFKQEGKEITFDAVPKLAPRADVIYRVSVRGTAPGDLRFRARIKADGLAEPVLKEESTKVYGDEGK